MKGVNIVLDPMHLGEILHIPCDGFCEDELLIKEDDFRTISEDGDIGKLSNLDAKALSVEMKLLHRIMTKLFFPKVGRHDFISGRDICVMHHIVSETPLNLSVLMIQAMRETLNRSRAHLPYGMTLILVFQRFGVYFEGETISRLSHSDTKNCHTLHQMGFSKDDGGWIRRREEEHRVEGERPSSPPRECKASPDIQFVSDHEAGPSKSVGGTSTISSEPQSEHHHFHSSFRLEDD